MSLRRNAFVAIAILSSTLTLAQGARKRPVETLYWDRIGNLIYTIEGPAPAITVSLDGSAWLVSADGTALIAGFVSCPAPESVVLRGNVTQEFTGVPSPAGAFEVTVTCAGNTRWNAPVAGGFRPGSASAVVAVVGDGAQLSRTVQLLRKKWSLTDPVVETDPPDDPREALQRTR